MRKGNGIAEGRIRRATGPEVDALAHAYLREADRNTILITGGFND